MAITDLTGYTWVGKTDVSGLSSSLYLVNFTSNDRYFYRIEFDAFYDDVYDVRIYEIDSSSIFVYNSSGHLIEPTLNEWLFTGGTDVTNAALIAWLEVNGTLTPPSTRSITNIYKGALERSDIQKIYKGTTLLYEKVLPPQGETWVIDDDIDHYFYDTYTINFTSNGNNYTQLKFVSVGSPMWEFRYNSSKVADLDGDEMITTWTNQAYRTLIFETSPTGDLLTWLEGNAVKQ